MNPHARDPRGGRHAEELSTGVQTQDPGPDRGRQDAGFYAWRSRTPSNRTIRQAWLTDMITRVHLESNGTHGARRVHAELSMGRGIMVGHNAVAMLMHRANLQGLPGARLRRLQHQTPTASDLVDRQFTRSEPDQLWVTDITEHPTREGKVYCSVVLDTFSRRIVGWSIDSSPTASLVTNALGMAIENRSPSPGALIHSDHGTQFTSWAFTRRALDSGVVPSMGSSVIASTTPSSNRSGPGCRSSCSTADDGRLG